VDLCARVMADSLAARSGSRRAESEVVCEPDAAVVAPFGMTPWRPGVRDGPDIVR
jgi:hypothetical protein